jgi:ADP-ribose pyrophosphatase YjhB (NUDIX family)
MQRLLPAGLHRALYRVAYRLRGGLRRRFRIPIYGVSAILRDAEGRVLLVRHSYGPDSWALPGGGHRRAEDPELAVRLEIREELGIGIEALEAIATLQETISGAPHTASLFAGIVTGEPRPDGREVIEARFFAYSEMPVLPDGPSRVRLDLWQAHLERQSSAGHSKES